MQFSDKNLAFIGAAIYMCEGTSARVYGNRKYHAVEFTNKDPRLVKTFLLFLRKIISAEEDRIKAELFIYPDHNETKLVKYWSKITNIPQTRFNKTIRLKQKNLSYKPNPLGTLKIRYTHKEHFFKIQGIIESAFGPKYIIQGEVA